MANFALEELSGSLIKQGRFRTAIVPFFQELDEALGNGVISHIEMIKLQEDFCFLLITPDAPKADSLGTRMINLAIRIPGKVPASTWEEFAAYLKKQREA